MPALLITAALACAPATALAQSTGDGRLVIVGGGLSRDTESIYRAVLSARDGEGPLCIIPTAGAEPEASIASAVTSFDRWGGAGTARGIMIATSNAEAASDPAVVEQIRSCSGFYFTGGVQSRIVDVFRPRGVATPAHDAVMARFRDGAVVAGSSAGAAIMSDPMIAGGSTREALRLGAQPRTASSSDDDDDAPSGVLIEPGIGFLHHAIVDQHFLARGRIGRLVASVVDLERFDLGFGIDENTALVVDGSVVAPVGASGVIVIDEKGATRNASGVTGLGLHLLGTGDSFDIDTRRVTTASTGRPLTPSTTSVTVPDDIFARWAFLHLLHEFARAPRTEITLAFNGGRMILRKGPDFAARSNADGAGVQDTPAALSITGLLLDVIRD